MKRTLEEFGPLTPAEQTLRDKVGSGLEVVIGNGTLPEADAGPERQIRAGFIRYLALGGCDACRPSEKGVRVSGALIASDGPPDAAARGSTRGLDLEACKVAGDLALFNCRFPDAPVLRGTDLALLNLSGSCLEQGLAADGLTAKGGAFLRGVIAKGAVRLLGASLGGNLSCIGARFAAVADAEGRMGHAFSADRLTAKGGAFLRDVTAKGEVRLLGASLGGNLDCDGARFEAVADADGRIGYAFSADGLSAKGGAFLGGVTAKGTVRLLEASLGGNLSCIGARFAAVADAEGRMGYAFSAQGLSAKGNLILRDMKSIDGALDLTGAEVGALADDRTGWPAPGKLYLDRFRYGAILGDGAPLDADARLDWLSRCAARPEAGGFSPQPYEQLAKVLGEMGHPRDARQVLERKEHFQRRASVGQLPDGAMRRPLRRAWNWVLHRTIGYGHYPLRALYWLAGLWFLGWVVYGDAFVTGDFKPNNAFVLRADEWVGCQDGGGTHPDQLQCFLAQPEAAKYPRFTPAVYSADVLLPIVGLEMQQYWIPDASKSTRGILTRWFLWLQILAGWALTLLAVAGFSGIVKSDR